MLSSTPNTPFLKKNHNTPTRTENTLAYHIPQSRTEYHRNSFYPRTIRYWNLPQEIGVNSVTPAAFKEALSQRYE